MDTHTHTHRIGATGARTWLLAVLTWLPAIRLLALLQVQSSRCWHSRLCGGTWPPVDPASRRYAHLCPRRPHPAVYRLPHGLLWAPSLPWVASALGPNRSRSSHGLPDPPHHIQGVLWYDTLSLFSSTLHRPSTSKVPHRTQGIKVPRPSNGTRGPKRYAACRRTRAGTWLPTLPPPWPPVHTLRHQLICTCLPNCGLRSAFCVVGPDASSRSAALEATPTPLFSGLVLPHSFATLDFSCFWSPANCAAARLNCALQQLGFFNSCAALRLRCPDSQKEEENKARESHRRLL